MPVYHFKLDAPLPLSAANTQLRLRVRPRYGFLESVRKSCGAADTDEKSFIGTVGENVFRLRRNIRYRNSFLPRVWGRFTPAATGTSVSVTLFLHPLVAAFMAFWLSAVGYGALRFITSPRASAHSATIVPLTMLVFGIALVCGGFFPEAFKARRLLVEARSPPSPSVSLA